MAGMLAPSPKGYRSGGASVGVFQLADCVVGALQPASKLPSSRRGVSGTGAERGLVTWAVAVAWAVAARGTYVMLESWDVTAVLPSED